MAETAETWQQALYDHLRAMDVTLFAYVPDAGHKVLIDCSLADPDAVSVPLTTEAEGVPIVRQREDDAGLICVLSNSFGFGGTNASLAFKRFEE